MRRARRAGRPALVIALLLAIGLPGGAPVAAAPVTWPTSTLVISEVQTGGASASDEFVEIANQGAGPVDLVGLELVYGTSTGSTVTRKASWATSTTLQAGQRTVIVNGAGTYAAAGDLTYSSGFAATGGALALRIIGGTVIDAVGWGDATNAFVEGDPAPAPPAGSSLERLPGGVDGNAEDSNHNASDWFVQDSPAPQGLAAPLVPDPGGPTPTPAPTPTPTASPSATPTAAPTATPTAMPTPTPTASPSPTPTAAPTATPTAMPTASPTPVPAMPIVDARALSDEATATIEGVLTTTLGGLEAGRTAFVEDGSAGIALYLEAPVVAPLPAGTPVRVTGTLSTRYAQRTMRVIEPDVVVLGPGEGLPARAATTGAATEALEGRRLDVTGTALSGQDELADGLAVSIDDGSGPLRLVITPEALAGRAVETGMSVDARGPLGQRDSSGTGTSGYRLYVTHPDDLDLHVPPPSPTPSPTPTASPTPSPSPTASSTPTPAPTASSTATPSASTIAAARQAPIGSTVTVVGVVTAEAGRLGSPPLIVVQDATGGLVVRLDDDPRPSRGARVRVRGVLADPYGQLELRAAEATVLGTASMPLPSQVAALGEATEARLVTLTGRVAGRPSKATSGDIAFDLETAGGGRVRIAADASSGLTATSVAVDTTVRLVGVAGQRASRKGAQDGYRLWLRDRHDIEILAGAPTTAANPSGSTGVKGGASGPPRRAIAAALRLSDEEVRVVGVVTAGADLLDTSGRRVVVQDESAAVEVLVPSDGQAPTVGTRVEVVGRVGTAYGAPRIRATSVEDAGRAALPAPLVVRGALTEAHAWRLITVSGRIDDTRKLGDRVRAELAVGAQRVVVVAQPAIAVTSADLPEGATSTVTGIVRLAYPNATDRRPSLLPRSTADIRVTGSSAGGGGATSGAGATDAAATSPASDRTIPDADLADLLGVVGRTVRVGGLVVELRADGFRLDDGTAVGTVILADEAADLLPLIEPDDAINVAGMVEMRDEQAVVVVRDPAAIVLGADLGVGSGTASPAATRSSQPSGAALLAAGFRDGLALPGLPGAGAGLVSLVLVVGTSLAVTWLRRRHARALWQGRVAARLAAIAGPTAAPPDGGHSPTRPDPSPSERGLSVG